MASQVALLAFQWYNFLLYLVSQKYIRETTQLCTAKQNMWSDSMYLTYENMLLKSSKIQVWMIYPMSSYSHKAKCTSATLSSMNNDLQLKPPQGLLKMLYSRIQPKYILQDYYNEVTKWWHPFITLAWHHHDPQI